jgi:SecD/SecF fusion protein
LQSRSYLFLGLVLVLAAISGFLYTKSNYSYGLDVDGGVRLTYTLDFSKVAPENREGARQEVINVFQRRAGDVTGVIEAVIIPKGADQVIVEMPGKVSLADAEATMGSTAKIEWYWAKNVNTETKHYREYNEQRGENPDVPEVSFIRTTGNTELISFKDPKTNQPNPEYKSIISGWDLILSGNELVRAEAIAVPGGGGYRPTFKFSAEGGRKMEAWCRVHYNQGENLAAVLDGRVISMAPLAPNQTISTSGEITGTFSAAYVRNLVGLLNSGSLPVSNKLEGAVSVDPTIGKFALQQITLTGMVAFAVIAVFLLVYYLFPGVIALLALGLYVLFSLTALKFLNATFSLAAIAGFILSVGMAVDANILVFERVKEEMRAGRRLQTAIDLGFKRAFPAILDSNACTIITSLVLAQLGTGPVKGFATTLIIGVLISLFTAVVVTRSLLMFLVGSGIGANEKLFGLGRQWLGEGLEHDVKREARPILEKSKLYFGISLATIIPGLIFLGLGGIKPNVEFTGGIEASYAVDAGLTSADIMQKLEAAGMKGGNVQFANAGAEKQVFITVPPNSTLSGPDASDKLAATVGIDPAKKRSFQSVGSAIRAETIQNAVLGVVISSALIILYLAMRFGFALGGFVIGLRFASSVIIALLHDIVVVLGIAAMMGYLMGWQISALFISAMLTVIGFSTHDSIVIFDRIRENLRKPQPDEDIKHLINRSITQSLARSINTSATVIVTLLLLVVMGSATLDLRHFNLAMLVGIVSGTYSSIFNAAPILYFWDRAVARRKGEENTMLGLARAASSKVRLTRQTAATATTTAPQAPAEPTQQSYGQVKRRQRASQFGNKPVDDEEI